MNSEEAKELYAAVERLEQGDQLAQMELASALWREMSRLAVAYETKYGHTIGAQVLADAAFQSLASKSVPAVARSYFVRMASRVLRTRIVERAMVNAKMSTIGSPGSSETVRVIEFDSALKRLEEKFPSCAEKVALHYFGGLNNHEIAVLAQTDVGAVEADLRFAKAWMWHRELQRLRVRERLEKAGRLTAANPVNKRE